jgi:hypothetical protein
MLGCQNTDGCGKCPKFTECSLEIENAFSTREIESLREFIPIICAQRMDIVDELIEILRNRAEQNPLLAEEVGQYVLVMDKATKKAQKLIRARTRIGKLIECGATEEDGFQLIRQGPDEASIWMLFLRGHCDKEIYKRAIALCRELAKDDDEYSAMLKIYDRFINTLTMENASIIIQQAKDQPQNPLMN